MKGQCQHPRLAPVADHFLSTFETEHPVLAAICLSQKASVWKDARLRRQALAARIALLSRNATEQTIEPADEAVDPPPEAVAEPSPVPAPKPVDERRGQRQKRTTRPALDLKEASNLFEALGNSAQSDFSDPDAGDGSGFGFEFSAPPVEEREPGKRSLAEPDGTTATGRVLRELPSKDETRVAKPNHRAEGAAKPIATMTDLSLAILTGDFVGKVSEEEPEDQDVPQDISSNGAQVIELNALSWEENNAPPDGNNQDENGSPKSKPSISAAASAALSALSQEGDEIEDAQLVEALKSSDA